VTTCWPTSRASDNYADARNARQLEKPASARHLGHRVGIATRSAQFTYALLGPDYDQSPYTQTGDRVAELAARGVRLVIEEFRTDVTKTRNYPDCPVMPTLVGSVGVLAAGWGCRWWAGRDKPKLVEASNPRRRWPRDPDDLEDAQKRPLRDPI
jgi:hypothetical protein